MQRCVAIHANGTSEVLEFRPVLHQELRRLGYRRFVVRTADGRALSSAVYARTTPSSWQFADAARKLWGLVSDVQAIDESGELVTDAHTPAAGHPAVPPPPDTRVAQPAFVEGRGADAGTRKAGVGRETPEAGSERLPGPPAARAKTRIDPRQVPELIARANHSLPDADPRKITRERAGDIMRAADALRRSADTIDGSDDQRAAQELAERLDRFGRALLGYVRPPAPARSDR